MNAEDQQLEAVLVALTAPDTSRIKQAEDALKPVLKKSACVGALMTQVASSGNVAVRQIAAVILRKKIVKLWKKLKKSAQTRVKAAILERLGSEPERRPQVRRAPLASSPSSSAALGDEERAVSVMALRACCAFVSTLSTDDDAMLFRDLVPPMVVVARSAAQQRDDAVLVQFFDAFAELAQTPVPVLAPHRLRQEEAALAKAAKIAAGQVVLGGDDDDDEAYEGPSSQEVAQTTLDQIALHDALREHHLGEVLQRLANAAAANSEPATRECLCFAYGQLAEHCQPEIVGHAAAVVPVVFEFLNDARAAVVGTPCYVLEMFCESMDARSWASSSSRSWRGCCRCWGTNYWASARWPRRPWGPRPSPRPTAGPYSTPPPPRHVRARRGAGLGAARALLEALGHVALAVGAARFAPYRDRALAAAAQNLELDSTELASIRDGFFANAKVMRGDFGPLLPQLVPTCSTSSRARTARAAEPGDADEWEDDVEDEESDDDLAGHAVMTVRTAMMNVKRAAIVALGNVAEYTEGHFAPHLDKSLDVLRVMVDYFHHEIRERSAIALQQLAHAARRRGEARALPTRAADRERRQGARGHRLGQGDGAASLPSPQLATYVNACVGLLARLLAEDTAKSVVAVSCEALNELLGDVGPAALIPALQPIVEATLQLANKQAPCQTLLGADDDVIDAVARGTHEEGDDDDEDHDNVLMDNVADLCGAVAKADGAPPERAAADRGSDAR
ncbi:hypothetical protein JL722_11711 [Aureococcus anophagefferens]|nr:hypothetical protein JL722_11711 [Aureococcus anophagefferens]